MMLFVNLLITLFNSLTMSHYQSFGSINFSMKVRLLEIYSEYSTQGK